jgi:hypothetical protein
MSKTVKYQLTPTCFGNSTILREHTSFLTKATLVKKSVKLLRWLVVMWQHICEMII